MLAGVEASVASALLRALSLVLLMEEDGALKCGREVRKPLRRLGMTLAKAPFVTLSEERESKAVGNGDAISGSFGRRLLGLPRSDDAVGRSSNLHDETARAEHCCGLVEGHGLVRLTYRR